MMRASMRRAAPILLGLAIFSCGGNAIREPRTRSTTATASASATASATAAATVSAEPVASAPAATASDQAIAPPPPPSPAGPVVTLLDPGAEPRKPIRYAFKMGVESMRVDMKLTMSMNAAPSNTSPTIRMDIDITPVAVDRDGTLSATYVVRRATLLPDVQVDPATFKSMSDDLKGLVQARGRCVVTARGLVKESSFEMPANAPPSMQPFSDSMKDAMRSAASPLPEAPVGIGARWEVHSTLAMRAFTLEQTSTHTLVGQAANVVEEDVSLTQTAPSQPMNVPGKLHPGTTLNLVSHTSRGRGHSKIALDHLVPTSRVHVESQSKVVVSAGTTTQSVDMSITVDTTIKPAP